MKHGMKKFFVMMTLMVFSLMMVLPAQAAGIRLNKKKAAITVGSSITLKVKGTSGKVTWKSGNRSVASVSKKGVVTGRKKGTTMITAKVKGKKLSCRVTVKAGSAKQVICSGKVKDHGIVYKLKLHGNRVLEINITNNSGKDINLGWAGDFRAVYGMSAGDISVGLNALNCLINSGDLYYDRVNAGNSRTYVADLSRVKGSLEQVTLKNIYPLMNNGGPVTDWSSLDTVRYTVVIPME